MNNINKQVTPDPHFSYEAFDLSARQVFNVNVGELIPVCCREVVPNDKFSVTVSDFVRALPMVTSPFVRAKQHLDFYFVPYTQLWSNWNQFITQRKQSFSSALNDTKFIPHFKVGDLYNYINNSNFADRNDIVGRNFRRGAFRLLNMLGYSYRSLDRQSNEAVYGYANAFRIAAYNKIWYDYYRQQQYDDGMHLVVSTASNEYHTPFDLFNYDYLQCFDEQSSDLLYYVNDLSQVGSAEHAKNFVASCQMRYRTWKKDLFTGLLPNTQFGAVSNVVCPVSVDSIKTPAGVASGDNILAGSQDGRLFRASISNVPTSGTGLDNLVQTKLLGTTATDIFALRKAYAVQKWRERALRAGNRVDNNVQAHFGSKPYYHNDWHPDYLGSVSGNLSIGDVDATAQTDATENGQLGNVAGKAIMSFDGHAFNFQNAGDFGVIMGIYSILPESEYNAFGIDRNNQLLEREDFFVEEYQNLGYEGVNNFTFNARIPSSGSGVPAVNTPEIIGFAPRYWNYKTAVDKVYGEFMLSKWDAELLSTIGAFSHWVSPRTSNYIARRVSVHGDGSLFIPLKWFYVDPRIFDSIFNASVDPQGADASDNFQFLVSLYMDCKAYRTMSVIGLPDL